MKTKLYALFALAGLLSLGAFSSCTTYVDPVGPAATTTTTVDPYVGTTQRTVTTRY